MIRAVDLPGHRTATKSRNDQEEPTGSSVRGGFAAKEPGDKRRARGSSTAPRRLFAAWQDVVFSLRRAKRVALLLDFDGTLVNLQARPGEVRLREPVRRVLTRLARHPRIVVAIVSGRALADIRHRVGVSGVQYLGLFGWEREGSVAAANRRAKRRIEAARTILRTAMRDFPGIWIEDKGLSVTIHFRGAKRAATRKASGILHHALRPFRPCLRVLSGNKSWELLPSTIRGKGAAVNKLLRRLPKSTLPIYVGDDTADESAFRALRRGITVRVGGFRHTQARFRLRNPEEVLQFLRKLEDQLRRGRPEPQAAKKGLSKRDSNRPARSSQPHAGRARIGVMR